jgi:hypothetical protein
MVREGNTDVDISNLGWEFINLATQMLFEVSCPDCGVIHEFPVSEGGGIVLPVLKMSSSRKPVPERVEPFIDEPHSSWNATS